MRLISLNIWQGKLLDQLLRFLQREASTTDLFCFQEMVNTIGNKDPKKDIFSIVSKALPGFQGFFEAAQEEKDNLEGGLSVFVKRTTVVDEEGDYFVYKTRNAMVNGNSKTLGKNVQFLQFSKSGKEFTIINFHGLWTGTDRKDNEDRILQSKKLKEFLNSFSGLKIVCGDFNLTLGTQSLSIIDDGMTNLIKEFGITSTRNRFFPYEDKYCDYILTDREVKVIDFKVLPDEVSDHQALQVDFT